MSDFKKFKEKLPSKEKFYSPLTSKKISFKEYEHVIKVWDKLKMKMMQRHYDFYLKCNVLLLADVLEKIRNNSLKNYGLCPSHYLSASALSGDAMLNMKTLELELISDAEMYLFFEKGMRGRVSYISKRFNQANNKYLKSHDTKQESKHIIYLNANNFYGYGMPKFLPTIESKWIDPKHFDWNKYSSNSLKEV